MRSKGISTSEVQIFTALLTLGLAAAFFMIAMGYIVDVENSVQYSEVERHTLNLAQVLLSSPKLAYFDGYKIKRGVIDWGKAEQQLVDGGDLLKEVGYPNAVMVIGIQDFDTKQAKTVLFTGPSAAQSNQLVDMALCLKPEIGPDMIFRIPPSSPWSNSEIEACSKDISSKYGTELRSFPILIMNETGSINQGVMRLTIMEVW